MNVRRHPTIADLAAVALCPSLIVLLISSLVYFLVMCVYRGGYSGRIGYIWFMFIMGTVGIARLSIQESRKYAIGYASVLAVATFFVLSRFMTVQGPLAAISPIINAATIALVWLLADRITYDCTLIDEDQDASGRGLLDGFTEDGSAEQDAKAHKTRSRGHQPGRTVMWLTAAALPAFGFGQMMLPQDDRWQRSAMLALAVYLFAALSLLVATSFLGVRRYLRQRGVDMPVNVSAAWLAGGVAMTAVMLLACFLLPQPGQMLANAELPQTLESPDWLKPSKYGWGGETTSPAGDKPDAATATPQESVDQPGQANSSGESGQKSGEAGGSQEGEKGAGGSGNPKPGEGDPGDGKSDVETDDRQSQSKPSESNQTGEQKSTSDNSSNSDTKSAESANESQGSEASKETSPADPQDQNQGDQAAQSAEQQQQQQQQQSRQAESQSSSETPSPQNDFLPFISKLFKPLIYLVLIGFLLFFAWIQRREIAAAWRAFLAWLRGETAVAEQSEQVLAPESLSRALLPFSAFRNPLGRGGDPREAVIVTYQAAEAWWREHGQPRRSDETPFEYSRRLRTNNPADRDALVRLTEAYNRIVYGNDNVQPPDLAAAAAVWKTFVRG